MAVIWWIRRDLRLSDNYTLNAALATGKPVIPVFILDLSLATAKRQRRLGFLFQALRTLDLELKNAGSGLVIRSGQPARELERLISETGAKKIFAGRDYTPTAMKRDSLVAKHLPLELVNDQLVVEPEAALKSDGTPYTVFTPFSKKWRSQINPSQLILSAPSHYPPIRLPHSERVPETPNTTAFYASETEAASRLEAFAQSSIFNYAENRDRLDIDGTSMLSPYFRFGLLSHRQAVSFALNAINRIWHQDPSLPSERSSKGPETWLNELIWREFYIHILANFPHVSKSEFNRSFSQVAWRYDQADLNAWKLGKTGLPVVDAAMRQLAQSGWMHNRARMIVASFLVKDLLIDWREGEKWFAEQLVDADPAANNGGWQWSAGTGTDAAPYFRVFNPVLQGQKFDPDGAYVRKWVPELSAFPPSLIHKPWEADLFEQQAAQCKIGTDYPFPIVEREFSRQRALRAYQRAKEQK